MRVNLTVKLLCVQIVLAVAASQASAACLNPAASTQAINQFKANPLALVAPDSDTRTIEATTRDLAGTDASLAADLVHLAERAAPRFQTAIAAGLAQAAIACSTVDQQAAQLIQQAVASFQDGQFQSSFAAVAGDLSTAATDAATASAAGSVGSDEIINPNASAGSGTSPGGGGSSSPVALTLTGGFTINPTPVLSANNSSATAANTISPSR